MPQPSVPAELDSISPSRFAALSRCALQEIWSAARADPLLPVHPSARVGTATHKLLEDAARGRITNVSEEGVAARWLTLIASVEDLMRSNWREQHLVPLSSSVPDYEVRRIRASGRALEIASDAAPLRPVGPSRSERYGFELYVETIDGLAGGWIDAVVPSNDGPVLRDYKTGTIHETHGGMRSLKADYVLQLHLYAAIYASATGVWPARLELVPMSGMAESVPFEPPQCEALLADAVALLEATNLLVRTLPPGEAMATLADPEPRVCGTCPYRPVCPSYWSRRERSNDEGWPSDIRGTVSHLQELGNGTIALTVRTHDGSERFVRGLTRSGRHPALESIAEVDGLAMFNLRGVPGSPTFHEGPYTTIYHASDGASLSVADAR